jgi:hypothetical protein
MAHCLGAAQVIASPLKPPALEGARVYLPIPAAAQQAIALPVLRTPSVEPNFKARMNEGGFASVKVKVVISPEGVPVRCEVVFVNGPRGNGDSLCAVILKEARYSPALTATAGPVAAIAYIWSQWDKGRWLGSAAPEWDPVDLALQVNKMPPGFRDMSTFQVRVAVDSTGRLQACEADEARLSRQARDLLCQEVARETIPPALDESGAAVPSVRPVRVRLVSSAFNRKLMSRLRSR